MACYVQRRNDEIEIWVPRSTTEGEVQAAIKVGAEQGFRVIVYRSGTGDLAALTSELLRINIVP